MNNVKNFSGQLSLSCLIILIFMIFPCINCWAMYEEQEVSPQGNQRMISGSLADKEKEKKTPSIISQGYSGPEWGLLNHEIEYLFENSKDLVCIVEFGGHLKRVNKAWQYALGWESKELLETPYITFVHPEDVEKTLEYEKTFMPAGLINRYRCKDGSYRWLDWIGLSSTRKEPIKAQRGYPLYIARDITLHKVLEKELDKKLNKISEEKWYKKKQILEAITEIQISHTNSIFYEDAKNADYRIFQIILQNIIKLSESEFGFISEIDSDQITPTHYTWEGRFSLVNFDKSEEKTNKFEEFFNDFTKNIVQTKKTLIITDVKNYPKKIEILPDLLQLQSFLGVPLFIQDKLVGIIGLSNCVKNISKNFMEELDPIFSLSGRIINERKRRLNQKEAENQQLARKQAEAENLVKSSFLAHMSHEIRTPLTGLLGTIELINKERLHEEDLNYLQIAHGAGLALLSILNDILDTSKVEAGQLTIETIKFNPIAVMQEVTQLLSLDASKKGIELKLIANSQIPIYLMGDPTRLRQIFFNLIGNAIKFTGKGSVLVSLDGSKYDKDHFILVGEVIDTGIGMSSESLEKLFKPFYQADTSILRRFGGTGLGLFITKKLCEIMGGDINASSEIGKGSTFRFQICLGQSKDLIHPIGRSFPIKLPDKLPNIQILVAEDNAINQIILKTILTKAGCSVTTVWNGQEALEAIAKNHYDLILMDGEMSVMDGLKATQKIRETFNLQTLPIIGVTAHAMVEDRERFLNSGMNGYLTKPIQKEALYTEILRCLSCRSSLERE